MKGIRGSLPPGQPVMFTGGAYPDIAAGVLKKTQNQVVGEAIADCVYGFWRGPDKLFGVACPWEADHSFACGEPPLTFVIVQYYLVPPPTEIVSREAEL